MFQADDRDEVGAGEYVVVKEQCDEQCVKS